MNRKLSNGFVWSLLAGALVVAPPLAFAQQQSSSDPTTQGSAGAGGYGPGARGYGTGPGMMGGGYGYGPGMMNGYGMGPGMMGGYGMGPGMGGGFGFGPLATLNLTEEQQRTVNRIQENLRKQHWSLLGQIQEQQAALRELYAADQTDPKKVGEIYDRIGKLQRQMAEAHAQALNEVRAALTPEQRKQLSQFHRGFRMPMYGAPGYGGMMGW